MLRFRSLGSGSSGNATVVEVRCEGATTRLLIDCGFNLRHLDTRLAKAGLAPSDIDGIFITHEHSDHIGCAQALSLRGRIPVWMSEGTWRGNGCQDFGGLLHLVCDGETVQIRDLALHPFTVPHDTREPLQLICSDGARRLGILTDLGHVPGNVLERLGALDALLLEFNHDPHLLADSRYPPFLKRRVGGPYGHLSNSAATAAAAVLCHAGLKHLVAAHLSVRNNRPDLVRQAMAQAIGGHAAEMLTARATEGTPWLDAG